MSADAERQKTRSCARCGALNGAEFDRCIRCGAALSSLAVSTDRVRARIETRTLSATNLIALLTTIVFAGQVLVAWRRDHQVKLFGIDQTDFLRFGGLFIAPSNPLNDPWQLLSAVFVHIGILHFGMNMLGLINLGRVAESLVGPARFLTAYVVTGIAGFATTLALAVLSSQVKGTAGASGALFGLMGLILGFLLRRRDPRWKAFAMQAVFYSLLFGFGVNAMKMGIQIDNSAHIGGLVCGTLFGIVYGGPRPSRSDLLVNIAAALSVLACVAALALAQLSPRWRYPELYFLLGGGSSELERPAGSPESPKHASIGLIASRRKSV